MTFETNAIRVTSSVQAHSIGKFENVEILFYYQSQTLLNPLVDVKSPFAFKERIPAHIVLI